MTRTRTRSATDPRLSLDEAQRQALSLRSMPAVARQRHAGDRLALVAGVLGALGLGALTLLGLSGQRTHAHVIVPTPVAEPAVEAAPPVVVAVPEAPPQAPVATTAPAPAETPAPDPVEPDPGPSRAMPMVIDNTDAVSAATGGGVGVASAAEGSGARDGLSADELFAMRASGDEPPSARATLMGDPTSTVVQGTILPAVLETAVNSDLPGYARAIVSRDVRSFDGNQVLIPRGSRLVGQYKSGLAAGQSRAYIMWTRLVRPDGVSVQLGSPAMDAGGEIGLPGEVNRHFWQRFGASMLLTVVSGLASASGDGSSLVIASGGQSAAGVALESNGKIPPTIRVPLGTPIQVFVARDLDFSGFAASATPPLHSTPAQEAT